jgi:RNA polymerase sigma factor (TIGR02999 family)
VLPMSEATRILSAIEQGDPHAAGQLLPLVYDELRRLAAEKMAQEKPGQTLQATALVHEAYVRLVSDAESQHWNSRGHFFAAAAEAMRRILVEKARRKQRLRHGGGRRRLDLDKLDLMQVQTADDLLELDEALERLAGEDASVAEVVKLRYFAGLTIEETAAALDISVRVGFCFPWHTSTANVALDVCGGSCCKGWSHVQETTERQRGLRPRPGN